MITVAQVLRYASLDSTYVIISTGETSIPLGECRMLICAADANQYVASREAEPWLAVTMLFAHVDTPACFVYEAGADRTEGSRHVLELIDECGADVYLSLQLPSIWDRVEE